MRLFHRSLLTNFLRSLLASVVIAGQAAPAFAAQTVTPIGHGETIPNTVANSYWNGLTTTVPSPNSIVGMSIMLTVPPRPSPRGHTYIWPGLQPGEGGPGYLPVGYGVLQPVLTWGYSCAPTNQPPPFTSWWISGVYYNNGRCLSGPAMNVNVGDSLLETYELKSTGWTLTINDLNTNRRVAFGINLLNQSQIAAIFTIESYDNHPVSDVTFQSIVIAFAQPVARCELNGTGKNYNGSRIGFVQSAAGGRICEYRNITLFPPPTSGNHH